MGDWSYGLDRPSYRDENGNEHWSNTGSHWRGAEAPRVLGVPSDLTPEQTAALAKMLGRHFKALPAPKEEP